MIYVELVYDHVVYSRFQCSYFHKVHSRFSCLYSCFHIVYSVHKLSLFDIGCDHVFPFKQSSLHNYENVVVNGKESKFGFTSDYHQIRVRYGFHACLIRTFRLTIALRTFLRLLSHILYSFIGKFVIICFDDIF